MVEYKHSTMGCFCFKGKTVSRNSMKEKSLDPAPRSESVKTDPNTLIKLNKVFCQVHEPSLTLVPKYHSFLLFTNTDISQRTDLQRSIFSDMPRRDPILPVDTRENKGKVVVSLGFDQADRLAENLHSAFETLAKRGVKDLLVVFERNSIREGDLFIGTNVQDFAAEFAQFCMAQEDLLRADIASDYPNLPQEIRLEACRRSNVG